MGLCISQTLLVSNLGLDFSSIRFYQAVGAGPQWKAGPKSPLQASVEPEHDLYFYREWIDMSKRNSTWYRGTNPLKSKPCCKKLKPKIFRNNNQTQWKAREQPRDTGFNGKNNTYMLARENRIPARKFTRQPSRKWSDNPRKQKDICSDLQLKDQEEQLVFPEEAIDIFDCLTVINEPAH